jgi:putative ABC transport system ATP-binding protein
MDAVDLIFRADRDGMGVTALRNVRLVVSPGELVAVTGRSGSGKSSLLNVAGGLVKATAGNVTVCGEPLRGRSPKDLAAIRRNHVGYVFQDLNLLPTLTAAENTSLPLELAGWDRAEADAAARQALVDVELAAEVDRYPDELSGGQKQRVAIARGLVGQRSLLLADEPTAALDDVTGEVILRLVRAQCDRGAAALMVTHDSAQAAWADRVVRLVDGAVESITARPSVGTNLSDFARPADDIGGSDR